MNLKELEKTIIEGIINQDPCDHKFKEGILGSPCTKCGMYVPQILEENKRKNDLRERLKKMDEAEKQEYCCDLMKQHANHWCPLHIPEECPDSLVLGPPVAETWRIPIRDGGTSYVEITHCPWCSTFLGKIEELA